MVSPLRHQRFSGAPPWWRTWNTTSSTGRRAGEDCDGEPDLAIDLVAVHGIYYMLNCQIWQESENGWIYLGQFWPWDWDHETAHCNHRLPQILLEALFNGLVEGNICRKTMFFPPITRVFLQIFPSNNPMICCLTSRITHQGESPRGIFLETERELLEPTQLEGHHSWDWSFRQRARIILCCPTWCFRISWLVLIKRTCGKKSFRRGLGHRLTTVLWCSLRNRFGSPKICLVSFKICF